MTREEAKYQLRNTAWLGTHEEREKTEEAVEMAIMALSGDKIVECPWCGTVLEHTPETTTNNDHIEYINYPIITCEDAISREDVIALVQCSEYELQDRVDNDAMCDDVRKLPSVTPSRRKGHWISREGGGQVLPFWGKYQCSECGAVRKNRLFMENFCPNCGADMREGG